jgi:hypothetical protein
MAGPTPEAAGEAAAQAAQSGQSFLLVLVVLAACAALAAALIHFQRKSECSDHVHSGTFLCSTSTVSNFWTPPKYGRMKLQGLV